MSQDQAEERKKASALLARFLPRAMEDGVLDEIEQRQLKGILDSGLLAKDEVQRVFREYLLRLRKDMAADGLLTPAEIARCREVVTALRIPRSFLPPEVASMIDT